MNDLTETQKINVKIWAMEIYTESLKVSSVADATELFIKKVSEL